MKLVILEDRFFAPVFYISQFIDVGIDIERLLLFDNTSKDVKMDLHCKNKYQQLCVQVDHVDTLNFLGTVQRFYKDPEVVFLFDIDLEPDRNPFPNKIQIAFAHQKFREKGGNKRFFFYSTVPNMEQNAALNKYFAGNVIECKKAYKKIDGIDIALESTILLFRKNLNFCSVMGIEDK